MLTKDMMARAKAIMEASMTTDGAPTDLLTLSDADFPHPNGLAMHNAMVAPMVAQIRTTAQTQFDAYLAKRAASIAADATTADQWEDMSEHVIEREVMQGCVDTVVAESMARIGIARTMLVLRRSMEMVTRAGVDRTMTQALMESASATVN